LQRLQKTSGKAIVTTRYPHLLSNIHIGPKILRNRAYMAGHSMGHNSREGFSKLGMAYLAARAKGGAAMIGVESAAVHVSSIDDKVGALPLYSDEILPSLAETADMIHRAGSQLMMVLQHRGPHTSYIANFAPAVAPSAIPDVWTGDIPRVLKHSDIREITSAFAAAAGRCRAAGVDVVEIMGALDYLVGSFLNPALNRRTDEYGGSTLNRTRFLLEVLEAVREATKGEVAVGLRLSACGVVNEDVETAIERSIETIQLAESKGLLDYLSFSIGSYRDMHAAIPTMELPRMTYAELARRLRRVTKIPISFAGRIRSPVEAEEMLATGAVDLIAMARTWIAEPEWIRKAAAGVEDQIRPCVSCNQACMGFAARALPGGCIVNPIAGREDLFSSTKAADSALNVGVVGGGPAGLEAARVAALRGHRVTLYEARQELGGDLLLAAGNPVRAEMRLPIEWWGREIKRLGVFVNLNARIDDASSLGHDKILWATGTRPSQASVWRYRPQLLDGIPGSANLPHGRDVLRGQPEIAGNVLIIDEEGGWRVLTLVEALLCRPAIRTLTVVAAERAALGENDTLYTLELSGVAARLRQKGVIVHLQTLAIAVSEEYVETMDGRRLGPFDSMVLSTGTTAEPTPEGVIPIGDCVAPRGVWAAVSDAHVAALNL
jgi:2,4-dienoyl-CoA reductase-like NADH-dependent reductase (Old Yellow Enzyme family)